MEKKSFKKYFTQNKTLLYVGIGIACVSFILYYFRRELHLYQLRNALTIGMVIGALTILAYIATRIKDASVDAYAKTFVTEMENQLAEFVKENEKHVRFTRLFDYASAGYALYDENCGMMIFGGDGSPRCEKYAGGALTYTRENFYIITGVLNLADGEYSTQKYIFPLNNVKSAETVDKSFTKVYKKRQRYAECSYMKLEIEGNEPITFTVHVDAITDETVKKLNRLAQDK